jgi:hypothetical protein
MPVKIARSAPRPSFELPELLVAIQRRVSLAARPEKREYLRQFGSHPGNVGLNGVIGDGVDDEREISRTLTAIAHILRPSGILLIGWNSNKSHPDPVEIGAAKRYFCRQSVFALPMRKTFPNTDHVYDWLVKTTAGTRSASA